MSDEHDWIKGGRFVSRGRGLRAWTCKTCGAEGIRPARDKGPATDAPCIVNASGVIVVAVPTDLGEGPIRLLSGQRLMSCSGVAALRIVAEVHGP